VSGDAAVVAQAGDAVLVAAVDALGHGPEAAAAAAAAESALAAFAGEELEVALGRCHAELRGTRGAAVSAARIAPPVLTWVGVGSVEGRLVRGGGPPPRPTETLLLHAGLVGEQLPGLRLGTLRTGHGDLLLFATDGIGAGFADLLDASGSPQQVADRVLAAHRREADDALVLAVRVLDGGR
jgi:hypothetical protein